MTFDLIPCFALNRKGGKHSKDVTEIEFRDIWDRFNDNGVNMQPYINIFEKDSRRFSVSFIIGSRFLDVLSAEFLLYMYIFIPNA